MRPAGLPAKPRVTPPSAAAIGNLELAVLRRLDGLLQGDYAGLLPGPGSDTGEARPYVAGDDTRHIDWAVTGVFALASIPLSSLGARTALRMESVVLERVYGAGLVVLGLAMLALVH